MSFLHNSKTADNSKINNNKYILQQSMSHNFQCTQCGYIKSFLDQLRDLITGRLQICPDAPKEVAGIIVDFHPMVMLFNLILFCFN
jgi:hypothetical protein